MSAVAIAVDKSHLQGRWHMREALGDLGDPWGFITNPAKRSEGDEVVPT